MADRILALAGPGKGPEVHTAQMGRVKAKVCGLGVGECVTLRGTDFEKVLESNGVHELVASQFMSAEYHGERFMICTLHAG